MTTNKTNERNETTTTHTPGPWHIDNETDYRIYVESSFGVIAKVGPFAEIDDEDKANARLIAAAPDLLAACEEATSLLDAHVNDHTVGVDSMVTVDMSAIAELLETLQAAIAKAKGTTI